MLWPKKRTSPPHDRTRLVGVDLNASLARGVSIGGGHTRSVPFDEPSGPLAQFISLEHRTPLIGRAGKAIVRTLPHLVCTNFLPSLGMNREWKGTRTLTAETALASVFEKMRGPLSTEGEQLALLLPPYLSISQIRTVVDVASRSKWNLRGTASLPMAIAAHRAHQILSESRPIASENEADWVVPIRTHDTGPGAVMILDVDEYAMSISVVSVTPNEIRLVTSHSSPRLSLKQWQDRLIDALSDRCVRLCRRDPRDSAAAEQAMYEQLDTALEQTRMGRAFCMTIRSDRWYQDLELQPVDLEAWCLSLARSATEEYQAILSLANQPMPLRAIWMTEAAARLPGLAASIYAHTTEQTSLSMLPSEAGAEAASALLVRWLTDTLPRTHLDGVIPLEVSLPDAATNGKTPSRTQSQ